MITAILDFFAANPLLTYLVRILAAAVCGALIGFERTKRSKEAGIRTHCIIAVGAALIMIISKYGFADLVSQAGSFTEGTRGADPGRIAAQVVTGISFLG
ncbi:MAG: MgtC/SapB family protein, partial [Clostridia bacterium]|nr:MgtC/SapB family protein [Clostridia bacterium]